MGCRSMAIGGALVASLVGVELLPGCRRTGETPKLDGKKEKLSYAMGITMARGFKRPGVELDADLVARGWRDATSGEKVLMTEDELRDTISAFQDDLKDKKLQTLKTVGAANKKQGEAFLGRNAMEEGVVTLPSGLQYKILKTGDGKHPTDADTVECHYRAAFIDGTEFDNSYVHGQPGTFAVTGVIAGWKEALKLMPVGSKWRLFVPDRLAYGDEGMLVKRGAGRSIGPNSTLLFDVELLAIKSAPSPGRQTASADLSAGTHGK